MSAKMKRSNVVQVEFKKRNQSRTQNAWILFLLDDLAEYCAQHQMPVASNAIVRAISEAEDDILITANHE